MKRARVQVKRVKLVTVKVLQVKLLQVRVMKTKVLQVRVQALRVHLIQWAVEVHRANELLINARIFHKSLTRGPVSFSPSLSLN